MKEPDQTERNNLLEEAHFLPASVPEEAKKKKPVLDRSYSLPSVTNQVVYLSPNYGVPKQHHLPVITEQPIRVASPPSPPPPQSQGQTRTLLSPPKDGDEEEEEEELATSSNGKNEVRRSSIAHYVRIGNSRRTSLVNSTNPEESLACLQPAEKLVIKLLGTNYLFFDYSDSLALEEKACPILHASESKSSSIFTLCSGNLRNVVIRDTQGVPVARVCFKEKHALLNSLVLAVYAPPETLVGTVEESPGCFMRSTEFLLGDADGDNLFRIKRGGGLWSTSYTVTYSKPQDDNDSLASSTDAFQSSIHVEKLGTTVKLKLSPTLDLTRKLLLLGFCIGILQRRANTTT